MIMSLKIPLPSCARTLLNALCSTSGPNLPPGSLHAAYSSSATACPLHLLLKGVV